MHHGKAGTDRQEHLGDIEGRLDDRTSTNGLRDRRSGRKRQDDAERRQRQGEKDEETLIEVVSLGGSPLIHHDRPEPAREHEERKERDDPEMTNPAEENRSNEERDARPRPLQPLSR